MSDCVNAEIRDLLPDYLHHRLRGADYGRIEAHLAQCDECRAELATLRMVRQAFAHAARIDTPAIVRALPRPSRRPIARSARQFVAWRIAAAISFVSLGGISLVVARSFITGESAGVTSVDSGRSGPTADTSSASNPGRPARPPVISFGGGVSDLATEDLESLLSGIESLEAAPPIEPDLVPQSDAGHVRPDTTGE